MFTLLTDDQVRRNDIDTLKRWLRPKLGGYTVAKRPSLRPALRG
jgi:hypothetical protein